MQRLITWWEIDIYRRVGWTPNTASLGLAYNGGDKPCFTF